MGNTDIYNRMKRPTMRQITFLEELKQEPKKWGASAKIAKKYDVTHGTVRRFFVACQSAGYLDEGDELTEKGEEWLGYYVALRGRMVNYFKNMGVPEADIMNNVTVMMEQMDNHVLNTILSEAEKQKDHESEEFRESTVCSIPFENQIEKGNYSVEFIVLKYNQSHDIECELSMADRGFEKPARLIYEDEIAYLELTPCEMMAVSRMDGEMKSGHLSSLSYITNGIVKKTEFDARGKIRIPLQACTSYVRSEARITCMIPITVTCSVGRIHMPESTALLMFWL